jgi:beta-galactosidase
MEPATRWLKRLGDELAPLQIGNGGPIVLVQVENEYGSFGSDHVYMDLMRKTLLDAGFTKAQLYTADGPAEIDNGSLPGLPVGINFDGNKPNSAEKAFASLRMQRPQGPFFNSEFWAGWFDHWGSAHAHTSTETQAANLAWILGQGDSVSIYMFHGGTDFGWMNGANSSDAKKEYEPDVTSYDYDAALDESGRPTPKFYAFRNVIAKATGIMPPPVPQVAPPIAIPPIQLTDSASLWTSLPKPIPTSSPETMEDVGQAYGYILYRAHVGAETGQLDIRDYAQMYLDGKPISSFDRRLRTGYVSAVVSQSGGQLDVLVENMGRINFSHQLLHERKGIVAYIPPEKLLKWSIYPLPMQGVSGLHFTKLSCTGPCFYRGRFTVAKPADTFFDTSHLTKGQLWVNGHVMGRFWNIGPQKTLYIPGPWLKQGVNEVIVFDIDGHPGSTLEGLTKPNLGQ